MDKILIDNYLEYLPEDKKASILDFGCGEGRVLKFLKDNRYENYLGIDLDQNALNLVPDDLKKHTIFNKDPIQHLSELGQKYDCIVLKDVIYYFPREKAVDFMRNITQHLKPDGVAIVEVFNGAQLTSLYTGFKDIGIQTIYTETSLKQICELSNLDVKKLFEIRNKKMGLRSILFLTLQGFWNLLLKCIYILERGVDSNNPRLMKKSIVAICRKV